MHSVVTNFAPQKYALCASQHDLYTSNLLPTPMESPTSLLFYAVFFCCCFFEHNHTPSGKKTVTGVQVITASQVQSIGGRPFRPAHNRAISKSTRGTHFQVMSKGTHLTMKNPLTTHSVEV